jgi:hypothetical protein
MILNTGLKSAPAKITAGLVVAWKLCAPPGNVDIDATAFTAPIVPFQSAILPSAPSAAHATTLSASRIFTICKITALPQLC